MNSTPCLTSTSTTCSSGLFSVSSAIFKKLKSAAPRAFGFAKPLRRRQFQVRSDQRQIHAVLVLLAILVRAAVLADPILHSLAFVWGHRRIIAGVTVATACVTVPTRCGRRGNITCGTA